jgi:hypothetical protein
MKFTLTYYDGSYEMFKGLFSCSMDANYIFVTYLLTQPAG